MKNNLVGKFIEGVTKDMTWGYESQLHNGAKEFIYENIPVLKFELPMTDVKTFNSTLNQCNE